MSSRRPVSFHQPRTMCGSTRRPLSTRCWIASVISSSPRAEGSIARAASWTPAVNMYTPTSARSVAGSARLLHQPHARGPASPAGAGVELGDAVVLGVGHRRQQDQRVRLVLAEGRHEIGDAALQQVVAEVHHERARAEERLRRQHRVREPERLVLQDVGDAHAEARAVAGDLLRSPGRSPAR